MVTIPRAAADSWRRASADLVVVSVVVVEEEEVEGEVANDSARARISFAEAMRAERSAKEVVRVSSLAFRWVSRVISKEAMPTCLRGGVLA